MRAAAARLAGRTLKGLSGRPVEALSTAWLLTLVAGHVGEEGTPTGLGLRWLLLVVAGFLIGTAWAGWLRQRAAERGRERRKALLGAAE